MSKRKALDRFSVVELYAGTARSAEAFRHWQRSKVSLLVDNDQFAVDTYRLNYPKAPYLRANLALLSAEEIAWFAGGRVDVLLGCPPCAGFSDTGSRNLRAYQNSHLTRFSLIAQALMPLAVAMENVPIAGETGRFRRFVERMAALGYESTWGLVNAALRGSGQCRHRLLYVAMRSDVRATPVIPAPHCGKSGMYFSYRTGQMTAVKDDRISLLSEAPGVRRIRSKHPFREHDHDLGTEPIPYVDDVLDGLPTLGTSKADRLCHYKWDHTPEMVKRMAMVPEGGRWAGGADHFSHSYGRLHRKGLARTVTTFFSNPGSGRFWHPTDNRAISLREAARFQGFPDSFRLIPNAMASCRLVGNALDAALADVTYRAIRSCLS